LKKVLTKVKLSPSSDTNFSPEIIQSFFSSRNFTVHLEKGISENIVLKRLDQNIIISGIPFKVVKTEPRCGGITTRDTVRQ